MSVPALISGVQDLPQFYFARGAQMRLTVNMDSEFSLSGKFVAFGIQARSGTVRRIFRTDLDEANVSVTGQVLSIVINPTDETVPAFTGGWTLEDVQAAKETQYWVDFSATEGSPALLRLQGYLDWIAPGDDIPGGSSVISAPEVDVTISSGAVAVTVSVVGGEVGVPVGGTTGQVLRKTSGSDYATEWATVSGTGDAVGPASATDNAIARFDGTGGKAIQNSGITIADGAIGTLAGSNSGDVTLAGSLDYITISGQQITRNAIDLATDVTGVLPVANFATGTPDGTKFVRDDGTLQAVPSGSGTVTSVAVSGSDGIQVDSGSPITSSGTIALGIDASALRSHINVENGATADQTGAEIKIAYEAEADTNAFTDAEKTKLSGIATSANNYVLPVATTTVIGGVKRNEGTSGQFVTGVDASGNIVYGTPSGAGTVTSVAVSGSDGIEIDSGSPITASGTIALGVNASTLKTHLSLNNVENTALSTWAGSTAITTLGTIATGSVPLANVSGTGDAAAKNTGTTAGTLCAGDDSRLSDSRTPTSHTHGNITNAGAIGSTTGLPIKTGTSGVLEVGAFGTGAGQFAEGNHDHAGVYQPLDTQLTDVAALTYASNALKVIRVNAGETAFELATPSGGSGDVATDAIWDAKGDLAVGTGSNTAAKLTAGTNGHVLTADSAETTGLKWAAPSGGEGGYVLIETQTASASSALTFDDAFDSTYDFYVIEVIDFAPSTDGVYLRFIWRDAGANLFSAVSHQFGYTYSAPSFGVATLSDAVTGAYPLNVSGSNLQGNATDETQSYVITTRPAASSIARSIYVTQGIYVNTSGQQILVTAGAGSVAGTTAPDGFRLEYSAGNIATGIARVWGIPKT